MRAEDPRTDPKGLPDHIRSELFSDRMGKPVQGLEQLGGMIPTTSMRSRLSVEAGKTHGAVRVTSYPVGLTLLLLDTHCNFDLEAIT